MKQVILHKRKYKLPESWQELTSSQKRQATTIVNHKMDHYDMRMQLIIVLLKITPRRMKRIKYEEILPFMSSASFVLDHFKIGLHGPGDSLELATFGEFRRWEKWVNLFQASDDKVYRMNCLDNILAIIYRPIREGFDPEKHQDKREPYYDWKVKKYMAAIANYPPEEKEILAEMFFTGRNELMNLFPELFKQTRKKELTEEEVKKTIESITGNADPAGSSLPTGKAGVPLGPETDSQNEKPPHGSTDPLEPEAESPDEKLPTGPKLMQKNEWIQVLRKVSLTPADFQKIDALPVTDVLFDLNERIREMEQLNAKRQKV